MAIEFDPPIVAGTTLVREAIQSQNFVPNTSGWQIKADGTATFTGVTVISTSADGTVTVADGEIDVKNSAGSLIATVTAAGSGGFFAYDTSGDSNLPFSSLSSAQLRFGEVNRSWAEDGGIQVATDPTNIDPIQMTLASGTGTVDGTGAVVSLVSTADSATVPAEIDLGASDGSRMVVGVGGYLNAIDLTTGNRDTLHSPSLIANWNNTTLTYTLGPNDDVIWNGLINFSGTSVATASGVSVLTTPVPAQFRPKGNRRVPAAHFTSTGVVKNVAATFNFNSDGTLAVLWGDGMTGTAHDANGLATGDRFEVYVSIPLGNRS